MLPDNLRVQCVHIMRECAEELFIEDNGIFELVKIIRKNRGVFSLGPRGADHTDNHGRYRAAREFYDSFLTESKAEEALDYLEVFFGVTSESYDHHTESFESEINQCFRQAGIGFQLENHKIMRIDSQLVHADVVRPALAFLSEKYLRGAQDEFLRAHEFYRSGRTKEAILNCCNAFESTMKAICDKRRWTYDKAKATAKPLIAICRDNGLVPGYWDSSLTHLTGLMESSVPTGRNKNAGHGQGSQPVDVPVHVASYILHMTASAILFLAQAEKELK